MIFEQLDKIDRDIVEALKRGVAPVEVMAHFGVNDDKIAQLMSVVEELGGIKEGAETGEETKSTTEQAPDQSTEETA